MENEHLDIEQYANTLIVPMKERRITPHAYECGQKQIWSALEIPSLSVSLSFLFHDWIVVYKYFHLDPDLRETIIKPDSLQLSKQLAMVGL